MTETLQRTITGEFEQPRVYPPGNSMLEEENTETRVCFYCRDAGTDVHEYSTAEGTVVAHQDCFADEYVWLESKSNYYHMDDCIWLESRDEYYHCDDTGCCDDCGEYYHVDYDCYYSVGSWSSRTICSDCVESGDYAYPQDDPDTLYHIDDLYWSDYDEVWYTDYDLANRGSGPLHCYSTDVLEEFDRIAYLDDNRTTHVFGSHLLFGVELETDSRGDAPYDIAEQFCDRTNFQEFGICKEDGSISGIELVTVPGTLEAHKTRYNWQAWTDELRPIAKGYYGNAGMHVHINKGAISQLTLGKMLVFANDLANAEFLSMVAQRDVRQSQWCGLNPEQFDKVGKSAKEPHAGKYSILNVTRWTVELRMFNSSLVHDRVIKNIEFCHAFVKFCMHTSARQLKASYFRAYVADNKKLYPYLSRFIIDRSEA